MAWETWTAGIPVVCPQAKQHVVRKMMDKEVVRDKSAGLLSQGFYLTLLKSPSLLPTVKHVDVDQNLFSCSSKSFTF
jgi:hypothetical protein